MERQPVESSLIRSVGYDAISSILEVEFAPGGAVYVFYDVPYSTYDELMAPRRRGSTSRVHPRPLPGGAGRLRLELGSVVGWVELT